VELDDIGTAREAKLAALQEHAAYRAKIMTPCLAGQVCAFMQQVAFGCQAIVGPGMFQMDKSPLPGAEGKVLQPADWKRLVAPQLWLHARITRTARR
jgi:hypothetical protein